MSILEEPAIPTKNTEGNLNFHSARQNRIRLVCNIFCIIIIILSIRSDVHFFDFSYQERTSYYAANGNPHAIIFYIIAKVIFAIIMFLFFNYIAKCWISIIRRDQEQKERVKFCCIILAVYVVALIHMYPGIWWCNGADEFKIFSFVQHLQIQYHQGTMASLAYILALMCYPKPAMVVLFQGILGAIILGNIVYDLYVINRNNKFLLFILLFSPCAVYFAMYPMRAYLFAVFFLAFIHYYLKFSSNGTFDNRKCYILTLLLCLIVNYRAEAKFLLCIYPLILLKKCKPRMIVRLELIAVCSVLLVSGLNTLGNQSCSKAHYYLMLSGPLSLFLTDDTIDKTEWESDIQNIDKVLDIEQLEEHAHYAYCGGERPDSTYTDEDLRNFVKSSMKIMIRHPGIYVTSKLKCARDSLALGEISQLGYVLPGEIKPQEIADYFKDADKSSHDILGAILTGQHKLGNINMFYVLYALWLPCVLLLALFITGIRMEKSLAIASAILIMQFGLTVFTAPRWYLMYYFVEYLVGWYLVIYSRQYFSILLLKNLFAGKQEKVGKRGQNS